MAQKSIEAKLNFATRTTAAGKEFQMSTTRFVNLSFLASVLQWTLFLVLHCVSKKFPLLNCL